MIHVEGRKTKTQRGTMRKMIFDAHFLVISMLNSTHFKASSNHLHMVSHAKGHAKLFSGKETER